MSENSIEVKLMNKLVQKFGNRQIQAITLTDGEDSGSGIAQLAPDSEEMIYPNADFAAHLGILYIQAIGDESIDGIPIRLDLDIPDGQQVCILKNEERKNWILTFNPALDSMSKSIQEAASTVNVKVGEDENDLKGLFMRLADIFAAFAGGMLLATAFRSISPVLCVSTGIAALAGAIFFRLRARSTNEVEKKPKI